MPPCLSFLVCEMGMLLCSYSRDFCISLFGGHKRGMSTASQPTSGTAPHSPPSLPPPHVMWDSLVSGSMLLGNWYFFQGRRLNLQQSMSQ